MMNAKEIANIWKEVVKIYNNTKNVIKMKLVYMQSEAVPL